MAPTPPTPDPAEILRYLGCTVSPAPAELVRAVEQGCRDVLEAARPRTVWRRFPLQGRQVAGTSLALEGRDILEHLEGCGEVILMAATLGPDVERLLMRSGVQDLSRAVVLDACASGVIEAVCNALEEDLRREQRARGLWLTGRFSPGYGDLPLSHQREICTVLDVQRRIGLTLSATGLMIPRKSVTALLGLSDRPLHRGGGGCARCSMAEHCLMRKGGKCSE